MSIDDPNGAERDWQREQLAEARYKRELYEPNEDPGCIACGHLQSEHQGDYCDVYGCACGFFPRIQARPVRFSETMQARLFRDEEVG